MAELLGQKEKPGTCAPSMADEDAGARSGLSRSMVWLLAVASGLAVANLYYNQPLLGAMGRSIGTTGGQAGFLSALTQVGYALGLLLVVPLGDIRERRGLIVALLAAVAGALVAVAVAPGFLWLAVASLALGATTITPQLIVPLAAGLAAPAERGRVVGTVMSGLLIGILLSRTVSGFVGASLGWRAMFGIAAGLMVGLAVVLRRLLLRDCPRAGLSYLAVLRSLPGLVREPVLRESCLFGAAGFAAFSAFWTTLAFFLAGPPYHLGSDAVGLFGLAGVAGALAAPVAGRVADRRSPRLTIGIALLILLASFAVLGLAGTSLWGLVVGVVLLDLAAQASHISNQTRIYGLPAEAHNRFNIGAVDRAGARTAQTPRRGTIQKVVLARCGCARLGRSETPAAAAWVAHASVNFSGPLGSRLKGSRRPADGPGGPGALAGRAPCRSRSGRSGARSGFRQ